MVDHDDPRVEAAARAAHDEYEARAPEFGYETRRETAVPWDEVPGYNRDLMLLAQTAALAAADAVDPARQTPEANDLGVYLDNAAREMEALRAELRTAQDAREAKEGNEREKALEAENARLREALRGVLADYEDALWIDDGGEKHHIRRIELAMHRPRSDCGCNPDFGGDNSAAPDTEGWYHHDFGPRMPAILAVREALAQC